MKRSLSLSLAVGLAAALSVPATAQEPAPTEVPEVANIEDPAGDANFLNDQDNAYGTPLAGQGDNAGPADVGSATDLLKVWFTNTEADVSLHFQTEAAPGNLAYDVYYRFGTNPGAGSAAENTTRGCLFWIAWVNGTAGAYTGETEATLTDSCNGGDPVAAPLSITEGPEATGIVTMTFPRSASPFLADGSSITAPFGVVRVANVGPTPTTATVATIDTTVRGTDYPLVTPEEVVEEKPKKNCKKLPKAKRKACLKKR